MTRIHRLPILILLFFTSCLQLDDDVVTELSEGQKEPEWIFITRKDGLAEDTVTTMLRDSQGYYWFGHFNKGITRWNGEDEYTRFSVSEGLTDNFIFRIVEAPDGKIWVATNKGYDIFEGGTIVASEFYNFAFTDFIFPKPGTVWLSSQVGVYVFSNTGDSLIRDTGCQFCAASMKLLIDSEENIWVASLQDIRRYNAATGYEVDKRYIFNPRAGFNVTRVVEIFEDEGKTIYGGSFFGQFNTFKLDDPDPVFFNFSTASSLPVSAITTYNNELWVGTQGSGVIKTNGTSSSVFYNELPNPIVLDLLNDGPSIWIATLSGAAKYTVR